jgi:SulP family sulfate permease
LVRVDASLYLANIAFLRGWLDDAVSSRPGLRFLILDFSAVNDIDAVRRGGVRDAGGASDGASVKGNRYARCRHEGTGARRRDPVRLAAEKLGTTASHISVKHALDRDGARPSTRVDARVRRPPHSPSG